MKGSTVRYITLSLLLSSLLPVSSPFLFSYSLAYLVITHLFVIFMILLPTSSFHSTHFSEVLTASFLDPFPSFLYPILSHRLQPYICGKLEAACQRQLLAH